jgi:NIMA (never in mitosis gene a)-related kinase
MKFADNFISAKKFIKFETVFKEVRLYQFIIFPKIPILNITSYSMKNKERYHLGAFIGEGSYGKVYQAFDQELMLHVCIKELERSDSKQKYDAGNEIKILKMVDHPNIVKYLDDYQLNNKQYIVIEHIETGNLSDLIDGYKNANKPIPEDLILKYFSQLVSVLKYCYDKRILHRDIKPNNILYLKPDILKVADFGIACVVSNETDKLDSMKESFANSPQYVSPEVVHLHYYSFPADVWSVGVIIYQLMALECPFEASNSNRTIKLIVTMNILYHQLQQIIQKN